MTIVIHLISSILIFSNVVKSGDIPSEFLEIAQAKRAELVENLAEVDDEIADAWLEEREISGEELAVSSCLFKEDTSKNVLTNISVFRLQFEGRRVRSNFHQFSLDQLWRTNQSNQF